MHQEPVSKYLYIHTFGCQMNEYDSLRVQRILGAQGYIPTEDIYMADVIFLNTCSVREKAEQKVFSFLGRLRKLKSAQPALKIILAGCMAQQFGKRLTAKFHHLDLVIGTRAVGAVGDLLQHVQETGKQHVHVPEEDAPLPPEFHFGDHMLPFSVSAPVTIMQGCDNFCTYCIVPYVRGRERSRAATEIIQEIRGLEARGVREVLLLGQNVNSYGRELEERIGFVGLLGLIQSQTGILRLRFTTSHPKDLTQGLMEAFATIPILCGSLHLPFQSGSDRVLQKMNRRYTAADYLEKVARLRSIRPDIALTSDVMVGFPGETEEDFEDTLELIETVQFDNLFSFRYSDRPFTKSKDFKGKIDDKTKARRLARLQALQAEITLKKNRAEVGREREILVEGESKNGDGQMSGRTEQNRIVNFQGEGDLLGRLVRVSITEAFSHSLKGELVLNDAAGLIHRNPVSFFHEKR